MLGLATTLIWAKTKYFPILVVTVYPWDGQNSHFKSGWKRLRVPLRGKAQLPTSDIFKTSNKTAKYLLGIYQKKRKRIFAKMEECRHDRRKRRNLTRQP